MRATRRGPSSRPANPRAVLATVLAILCAVLLVVGCGRGASPPEAIDDPGAEAVGGDVPAWFPATVRPPPGSVVVEVIEDPAAGFGRSVTWRAEDDFDAVVDHVDRVLAGLGWRPEDVTDSGRGGGFRQRTWLIANDAVYDIRAYEDDALEGVRVTVQLPAAS